MLGVSRTIYVNVDSPNLGFLYFNFLGGYQLKKTPCMLYFAKGLLLPYIIIVPDAADIVCGAKIFMWIKIAPRDNQFNTT